MQAYVGVCASNDVFRIRVWFALCEHGKIVKCLGQVALLGELVARSNGTLLVRNMLALDYRLPMNGTIKRMVVQ